MFNLRICVRLTSPMSLNAHVVRADRTDTHASIFARTFADSCTFRTDVQTSYHDGDTALFRSIIVTLVARTAERLRIEDHPRNIQ